MMGGAGHLGLGTMIVLGVIAYALGIDPRILIGGAEMFNNVRGGGQTVLMLGHQPGIGVFARRLLAVEPEDEGFGKYPTAATAVIGFDVDGWEAVGWETGRLVDFVVPRDLE